MTRKLKKLMSMLLVVAMVVTMMPQSLLTVSAGQLQESVKLDEDKKVGMDVQTAETDGMSVDVTGQDVIAEQDSTLDDNSSYEGDDVFEGDGILGSERMLEPKQFKSAGDIASGTYGNITWRIDAEGKLTVEGTGEFTAVASKNYNYDRVPWYSQRENIKSAVVRVKGMKDAGYMFGNCSSLTSLDLSDFDTSNVTNMDGIFSGCWNLTSLDVSDFDTSNVTNMRGMFEGCGSLTSLDVSDFDTSNVTNMRGMFEGCGSLTSLDVSGFDTSNVTNTRRMFWGCSSLMSLDLSGFDTSKVTNMNGMFSRCSLTSLDVSSWDVGKVTDMGEMFYGCHNLTSLDMGGCDKGSVTDMYYMFSYCSSLTSLDLSGFDTSNVEWMGGMFWDCSSLTSLDLSGFDTSNVKDMSYMFWDCSSLTSLDLSGFDTSNVTSMASMFEYCSSLTSLDLSGFDTSNVTSMETMFYGCSSLTSLDVSGFDTSNVTDMSDDLFGGMFSDCGNLTNLDVSGFDTSKVTDMSYMFSNCQSLTSLDVSGFDTSSVTDMSNMFGGTFGCQSLTSLDVSGFDTSKVTDMSDMFACSSLTNLDVSGFDTSSVTNMSGMFGSQSLTSLDVSGFDTSKVTDMSHMFSGCRSLTSLDLSSFDTRKVTDMSWMFFGCHSLKSLDVSGFVTDNVTDMECMFSNCSWIASLDISSFNMGSVTRIRSMFFACPKLTTIYIPYKVPELDDKAILPTDAETDIWQDADGNTYTTLPEGLDYSIILSKNTTPEAMQAKLTVRLAKSFYEKGSSIDTKDLTVVYRGTDGRSVTLSPKGADDTVNGYTLSAVDMNTSGEKIMTVSYNDGTNTLTETVRLTILAPLDVIVTLPETNYIYNGKQHRPVPTVKPSAGDTENPLILGKDYTVSYQNNVDAGDATFTVKGKNAFSGTVTGNFVIKKAPLTVTVADVKLVIGQFDALPDEGTLTYEVTGLCGSHKVQDVFDTQPAVSYGINREKIDKVTIAVDKAGTYDLIPSGAVLNQDAGANYDIISYQKGTLTIAKEGVTDPTKPTDPTDPTEPTDPTKPTDPTEPTKPTDPTDPTSSTGLQVNFPAGKTFTYTGSAIKPVIEVTNNGKPLTEGTDYTVKYSNNTKAGTAKLTVTGKGSFAGKQDTTFTIEPKSLRSDDIVASDITIAANSRGALQRDETGGKGLHPERYGKDSCG